MSKAAVMIPHIALVDPRSTPVSGMSCVTGVGSGRGAGITTGRGDDAAEDLAALLLSAEFALLLCMLDVSALLLTCDDVEDEVEDEEEELLEEVELELLLEDDDDAMIQIGTVSVTVSVVTVPSNAKALPDHVVLAPTVMPALAITVPANVVLAARVVAAAGVQKTSHTDAPINVIAAPAVDVSAPPVLKTYIPLPLSVREPPISIAPVLQYTPGVYVPIGPCVVSVERLIAPPDGNVNVHASEAKAERVVP